MTNEPKELKQKYSADTNLTCRKQLQTKVVRKTLVVWASVEGHIKKKMSKTKSV